MSESGIKIRDYESGDFETMYRIDQICFPDGIAFPRRILREYLNHPKSIARIAVAPDGKILGYVLARIESAVHAHILTLDVVPEGRKRKIGTALMDALHAELQKRGVSAAILEVAVRNLAAQHLYEKLQYQYVSTIPGYYHGREDAYQMARLVHLPRQNDAK